MTNKSLYSRTFFLMMVFGLPLFTGCSDFLNDAEPLNKFAAAYVDFHAALTDSEVSMGAIALDVSERPEHTGEQPITLYRKSFRDAFNYRASALQRTESARQAVAAYDSGSTRMFNDFEKQNDTVDAKSLALVEAANAIRDEKYRKEAVLVAGAARETHSTLVLLSNGYSKVYSVQLSLVSELANKNGDMNRISGSMNRKVPEHKSLLAEVGKLSRQEQATVRTMEEHYAAFKGMTGVIVDYVFPTTGNDNPK